MEEKIENAEEGAIVTVGVAEIHSSLPSHSQVVKHVNRGENPARFQRTDQWRPVYSWLESLDLDDVIGSNEISDWLAANPEVYDQLSVRHSRHHLMHYVKKCHIKILKKKKGKQFKPNLTAHRNVNHLQLSNMSASISANPLTNVPKDSNLYRVKREEALCKYEILVELEKKLSAVISEGNAAGNSKDS
ncbi:uncharacterized protein LOC141652833 [Silene latifolia]|uniref:uncharacterized protein LOC141652833 n=1 Tax=Silene latifolia TaxID=37657 RepID=UPI003D770851